MGLYYATYRETQDTPEEWHDWLVHGKPEEPTDLDEIADRCAQGHCTAELRTESGFLIGRVNVRGEWRLG